MKMENFIQHMAFDKTRLFALSNELKYVPIITNLTEFEGIAKNNIDENFRVVDVIFGENSADLIPARERDFYCPLSWMVPNKTEELYAFFGN